MRNAHILGIGHCLPEKVVTNDDLAQFMDTSDEWIQQRTGIRERRFSEGMTGASDLGLVAAQEALGRAGLGVDDVDMIVFATLSPDVDMPASACLLQAKLGAAGVPAFDVRNQCSGFLYGLAVANTFVRTGACEHVLLVGAEIHSTGLDVSTRGREVAVIFGDGAGAVVLGPAADDRHGILSTHLHAEGRFAEKLWLEGPGTQARPRLTEAMVAADDPPIFPKMEGRYVFRHAVTRFPEVIREALEANHLRVQDLSLLIPHQANLRISQMVVSALDLSEEQVFNNIDHLGNTTAASIPLALYEAQAAGRIRAEDVICLASFGAGFTWASTIIRW